MGRAERLLGLGLSTRRLLVLEALEPRVLLSASPTPFDQYMLEMFNRARSDPAAEAALYGIDLNEGLAPGTISADSKQPLAFNPLLISAAREHSQWLIDNNAFTHLGEGGSTPGERMEEAGYVFLPAPWGWGENLAWNGTTGVLDQAQAVRDDHANLFVDAGYPERSHRTTLMADAYSEIGVGVVFGVYTSNGNDFNISMSVANFAHVAGDAFLTGVAYDDRVQQDGFYTPGEGLGGIGVTATRHHDGAEFSVDTWESGGYSLALEPGVYDIVASGGALEDPVGYFGVDFGSTNVKLDFTPDMVPVDSPPRIDVDNIPDGTELALGETVEISWTAFAPDASSLIDLHWDTDTDPGNNIASEEGVTWGRIATGLTADTADSFVWTVDAPVGGSYHLLATIENPRASDADYAENPFQVVGVPDVSVSLSRLDFGELVAGSESRTLDLVFTNSGTGAATVSEAIFDNAADYSIVWEGGAAPERIEPGSSAIASVVFAPAQSGQRDSVLTLVTNDPSGPVSVDLIGRGLAYLDGVAVRAVFSQSPTPSETAQYLPESVEWVYEGGTLFAEVWVRCMDGQSDGIVGGTIDILYNPPSLSAQNVTNGVLFNTDATGDFDNAVGVVDELGGRAAVGAAPGVGVWARLGYVEFLATASGQTNLVASSGEVPFERAGLGEVGWGAVDVHATFAEVLVTHSMFDLVGDGQIGSDDYEAFMAGWRTRPGDEAWDPRLDFDGDGRIGMGDYAYFTAAWQKAPDDPSIVYPASTAVSSAVASYGVHSAAMSYRDLLSAHRVSGALVGPRPQPAPLRFLRSLEKLVRGKDSATPVFDASRLAAV